MAAVQIAPATGTMPVLQFCTPAQLQVDGAYQRPTDTRESRTLINRIAQRWDWGLFQPLVVARRADGFLYVVDGQHRLEAARVRGDIPQLPCVITAYDTREQEAAAFVGLNQERRPLSKMNLYKAALAAGDEDALVVERLVHNAGLRFTANADTSRWKPGWINNVVAIRTCHRRHGEKVTRLALEAMAKAFTGQILKACGTLFSAILPIIAADPDKVPIALLVDILREDDQEAWLARFRTAASERGIGLQLAAKNVVAEAYTEAMGDD